MWCTRGGQATVFEIKSSLSQMAESNFFKVNPRVKLQDKKIQSTYRVKIFSSQALGQAQGQNFGQV